ncbi:MAG: hypothetical protein Q9163_000190 [Psora crenata]
MSCVSPTSIYSSQLVTLLAGEEEIVLYAHTDVLSESDTFNTMIEGSWKESKESRIKLREWDVDTVARVLEWLYTCDYRSPFPFRPQVTTQSAGETESSNAQASERAVDQGTSAEATSAATPIEVGPLISTLEDVKTEATGLVRKDSYFLEFIAWAQKHSGEAAALSHGTALMAHAKMYAIAEYLLLHGLKLLAAKRLRASVYFIGAFQCGSPAIDDVAMVAKYIYANTNDYKDGKPDDEEPLRKFLSGVIASNFNNFVGEGANQVFQEGGDLMKDICHKMRALPAPLAGLNIMSPFKGTKRGATAVAGADVPTSSSRKKAPRANGSRAASSKTVRMTP